MKKYLFLGLIVLLGGVAITIMLTGSKKVRSAETVLAPNVSIQNIETPPNTPQEVLVLTYHSIEPKPDKKETALQKHYRISPENFEKQMQYLYENHFVPITFDQLAEYLLKGVSIPQKAVVLTFDDGWKNQYDYAAPILKKYGFTGTFFIVSKSRNGKYMTWDEIRSLIQDGFEIGSHTETHPKLTALDEGSLFNEVARSKKVLEDTLGITVKTLAYPYYVHDDRVRKVAADAGYKAARGGWGSFKNTHQHIFELVSQEPIDDPNPFKTK